MQRTKHGEFNWVDLSAKDLESQSVFYEALLGWAHTDMPFGQGQTYRWFTKDGQSVAAMAQLSEDMLASGVPTMWNTYVAVDDVDDAVAAALEHGATIAMPSRDVAGSGRMAAIFDPAGARLFFWKPSRPDESMLYFAPGALSWNDLNTTEPGRATEFYSELFGWDIQRMEENVIPYWQISIGGQGLGGMMLMPNTGSGEPHSFWMPYFGSADVAADTARAVELDAKVFVPPTQVGAGVVFSVLMDPAGATFALIGEPVSAPNAQVAAAPM